MGCVPAGSHASQGSHTTWPPPPYDQRLLDRGQVEARLVEQPGERRRHGRELRHPLLADQPGGRRGRRRGAGENETGPGHRRGEGEDPTRSRGRGSPRGARCRTPAGGAVGLVEPERPEHEGAVRVLDLAWGPRRAARRAHGRDRVLRHRGERVDAADPTEQLLVVEGFPVRRDVREDDLGPRAAERRTPATRLASTKSTRGRASSTRRWTSSLRNRTLIGCRTAPIAGTAKNSSRCRCEFHANVATRSPGRTPRSRSTAASASTRVRSSA